MIFYGLLLLSLNFSLANLQTAYPVMNSGSATFYKTQPSNFYNITYATPFQNGQITKCVHAINGFSFQSTGLTTTSNQFNFRSFINVCGSNLISLYCNFIDNHLTSLKVSYFAIYNDQNNTLVLFQIFDLVNGSIGTGSWNINYVLHEDKIVPNGNIALASKVQAFVCIQSIRISTNKTMKFKLQSAYVPSVTQLQSNIFIYEGTNITHLTLQVILFNIIRLTTEDSFHTHFWISSFSPDNTLGDNTGVSNYDSSYFHTFQALYGITLDFTNMSVLINGSYQKYSSVEYVNPDKLLYESNFMLNSDYFKGSQACFWWFAFTKYKNSSSDQQNMTSNATNQTTDEPIEQNSSLNQSIKNDNQLELIKYILSGILSGLVVVTVSVVVYKKCINKPVTQRPYKSEIRAPGDAVTMQDIKMDIGQRYF